MQICLEEASCFAVWFITSTSETYAAAIVPILAPRRGGLTLLPASVASSPSTLRTLVARNWPVSQLMQNLH